MIIPWVAMGLVVAFGTAVAVMAFTGLYREGNPTRFKIKGLPSMLHHWPDSNTADKGWQKAGGRPASEEDPDDRRDRG